MEQWNVREMKIEEFEEILAEVIQKDLSIDRIGIDDDIFECQSCGLRYSLASIKKMSVSIDYEGEINNLLNRADAFEASKDYIKAKEYLNKVLDFDSDNAEAKKRIERILIKEMYATFRISKAIIKPDQNNQLEQSPNPLLNVFLNQSQHI